MHRPHARHSRRLRLPGASSLALSLSLAWMPLAQAADKLTLNYVEAEKFADIGRGSLERERNLKTLGDFLQTLAAQLPEGQALQLTVLDVDLAGEVPPGSVVATRVLRGRTDWPRIQLRYALTQGAAVIKQGDVQLSDLGYLDHPYPGYDSLGALAHEKRMLQAWFRRTFQDTPP